MRKFKCAAKEVGNFLAQWWRDGSNDYSQMGGMRWYDCKVMSVVCGHEGPGYGSWSRAPLFRRLTIEFRGMLLDLLSPRNEERLLWFFGFFHVLKVARCALTEHVLVDQSHAGPDSGDIAMSCSRCGWGFRTVLY